MGLLDKSARQLVADIRNGDLTAVELMSATYDRIAALNPKINAIVSPLDRDDALALARKADEGPVLGPLHGLPLAIKDLANAAGFVTTMGSQVFAKAPPAASDDLIIARMRRAGAVIFGKTNTPEFGLGSHTVNKVFGATRNPWNPSRSAGGSSGGAAAAVAAGMLALADGSDMMGSLRNPPGWTGIYGLRPSWGAVPGEPRFDSFLHQLATPGPIARNPGDLRLLLSVQAGPDPRQPHATPLLPDHQQFAKTGPIAWLGDWDGAFPMEPGILDTCRSALDVFERLGHKTTPASAGFSADELWASWTTLRSWQIACGLSGLADNPDAREQLNDAVKWELDRGLRLMALEVHQASVQRSNWFQCANKLFDTYSVLALPTAQCWPFDVTLDWPRRINQTAMDTYHRWMQVTVPASLIGLPSIAIPAGFNDAGLPMGLQLIGPRGSDYALIELAEKYHEAAEWAGLMPPL